VTRRRTDRWPVARSIRTINATLYEKLNFNLTRDITPVPGISRVPLVMEMNLSVPANSSLNRSGHHPLLLRCTVHFRDGSKPAVTAPQPQ
jgi:hypothetical protein